MHLLYNLVSCVFNHQHAITSCYIIIRKQNRFHGQHIAVFITLTVMNFVSHLVGGNDRFSWYALIKTSALQM